MRLLALIGVLRLLLGLLEVREELDRALVEGAATLGEADPPGGAIEQARLQVAFEVRDMA